MILKFTKRNGEVVEITQGEIDNFQIIVTDQEIKDKTTIFRTATYESVYKLDTTQAKLAFRKDIIDGIQRLTYQIAGLLNIPAKEPDDIEIEKTK